MLTRGDDRIAIKLQGITKVFRDFRALQDVTVAFPVGVTGLLGPNGAGKSTLIKILLGLLRATSGEGTVLGRHIWSQGDEIRQLVGYMPEDDCYLPSLSGVQCVQFAARLNGLPATEALRRAHEILDFCNAGQERYRTVETYSVGMRQKLKFAQALVHDPTLLILDEPTAGLDPEEREAMLNRIRLLARDHGKTIVLCTHILPDVQAVSDFVVIMAAGRVSVAQPLAELSRPPVPSVQVRTQGLADMLLKALDGVGIKNSVSSDGSIVIEGDSPETIQAIWDLAAKQAVPIRVLAPAKTSMETIFLDAVRTATTGSAHAHS